MLPLVTGSLSVVAVGLVAYALGALLLPRIEFRSALEAVAFRCTIGLGSLSTLVLVLALFHGLRTSVMAITSLAIVAALAVFRRREIASGLVYPGSGKTFSSPGVLLVSLALLVVSVPALYPAAGFDETMYHLPAAKLHISRNDLAFTSDLRFSFMPQGWELLYTMALLVGNETTARLIHCMAMALIALGCIAASERAGGQASGPWSAAIWLGSPVVLWNATGANVDVGLTLFVFLGVVATGIWLESGERTWLVIGALLLGWAAGTKYTGLVFLALAAVAVAVRSFQRRNASSFILFVTLSSALFAPWVIRTWRITGTPFGLLLNGVFGYGNRDPVDAVLLAQHFRAYGYAKSLGSFLALPWNLVFHPDRFLDAHPVISPLLILGLPVALLGAAVERRLRWLLGAAFAYVVVWFLTYQNTRFLLPAVPMLSVAVGVGTERVLRIAGIEAIRRRVVASMLTAALLLPAIMLAAWMLRSLGPLPSTQDERGRFLSRVAGYDALRYLNQTLGDRYAVYALFLANDAYFARGRFTGDWFGPAKYGTVMPLIKRPPDLHTKLRALGITHLLVGKSSLQSLLGRPYNDWKTGLGEYFRSLYADSNVELFELRS